MDCIEKDRVNAINQRIFDLEDQYEEKYMLIRIAIRTMKKLLSLVNHDVDDEIAKSYYSDNGEDSWCIHQFAFNIPCIADFVMYRHMDSDNKPVWEVYVTGSDINILSRNVNTFYKAYHEPTIVDVLVELFMDLLGMPNHWFDPIRAPFIRPVPFGMGWNNLCHALPGITDLRIVNSKKNEKGE